MEQEFKCPDCGSSLYHVDDLGNEEYFLRCWKKGCGWKIKVKEINQ